MADPEEDEEAAAAEAEEEPLPEPDYHWSVWMKPDKRKPTQCGFLTTPEVRIGC